jgi:hypothetical protein
LLSIGVTNATILPLNMVYLCLPMANQGAYVIKKTTPFEVIPVSAGIFC